MDQEFWDIIYYEESREEFFRNNRELDADFARQIVEGADQTGVDFVFAHLAAFKESEHEKIAQIFAEHFKLKDGETKDRLFAPNDGDFGRDKETLYPSLSSFMVQHGQFEALIDGNFALKDPGAQQVLALVALSRFEEVIRYVDRIPKDQMSGVVSRFIETGHSKLLFTYLEESRNRDFAKTLSPDDVFRVLISQEPNFFMSYDPFSTKFVMQNINNMESHTPDEVVLGVLSVTDGTPIFAAREPIALQNPTRVMQAIEQHRNVGGLIKELKASFRESVLDVDIPAHIEIAYFIAPRDIDGQIIRVVQEAIAGIQISPEQLRDLDNELVKSIVGQENLDRISEIILTQRLYSNDRIEDRLSSNGLLSIPPRVLQITEDNPYLSDKSVCHILSLYAKDDGRVHYFLRELGVTQTGEEGYLQLGRIAESVFKQLDSKEPLSVPVQVDGYYDSAVMRDILRAKLSLIVSEYEDAVVKVPFGETLTEQQQTENMQEYARALDRIDSLFSSAGMRIIQDDKDVSSFLRDLSGQLEGTVFSNGGQLFIPSVFGDVAEKFGGVEPNIVQEVIRLRFEREYRTGTFEQFGEVDGETYTYADLTNALSELHRQFDEKSALTFSMEDPLVQQIAIRELGLRIIVARENKELLETLTPGSEEYLKAKSQYDQSVDRVDKLIGAVALQQVQRGEPITPFIEPLIEKLTAAGIIGVGEFFVPSALSPIGDHFRVYDASLIEEVVKLRYGSEVPELFREFGIEKSGEAGYAQAQQLVARIREDILSGKISETEKDRELYVLVFEDIIRLKSATYGTKDLDTVRRMLSVEQEDVPHGPGLIRPLERDQSTITPNEQVAKAYNEIISDFTRASEIVSAEGEIDAQKLDDLFAEIVALAQLEIEKLRTQLDHIPTDKTSRIDKLQGQIASLEEITKENLWMFPKMIQNIETLSGFKDMKSPLRQFLFVGAIAQHPNLDRDAFKPLAKGQKLDQAHASTVADFVTHVAFQETWKQLFESQSALRPLKHVMQSEDLLRFIQAVEERSKSKGTRASFSVVPVRGPLLEASGSIGDTCWNGRGINDEFPNITAVLIVKNSNVPMKSRMAGAGLLIQGMSEDGKPLLIIRGLNPVQNDITELMQDSFFREFAKFADGIAKEQGRQLAVVIDGHSGGSATNRPTLFAYLDQLRSELERVQLSDDESTTFNGYDIKGVTYLVDIDKLEESLDLVEQDRARERHSPAHSSGSYRPMVANVPVAPRGIAPMPEPARGTVPIPEVGEQVIL